ncbi:hypothetical protein [Massilia endophytica]|uniref:hypothetical protein n=1 Tax=Massilia endophytica TaxID=2899220 RepID=UPI001E2BD673|nr:hypothetical protein [Massilia endophytica]UGQ45829.1 hypothetical protein LSQ66_18865 [Massilia endophytica]
MKRYSVAILLGVAVPSIGIGIWQYASVPIKAPTVLAFRVGQPFEEVVEASTYPVLERSNAPSNDLHIQSGETFVTEPAVVLCFNDPQHGFVLPPTKFALVGYMHNVVDTVSTSPMLEKLSFDQAVVVLEDLQKQFKAGGWEPWEKDGSKWFDLSPEGKKRLYRRMFEPGYSQSAELRVPKKYEMTFRLKCTDGCWPGEAPPYLFLVDVGVGADTVGSEPGDPEVWEETYPGRVVSTANARFKCPAG